MLKDFIRDCYFGDEINGISSSHVNILVSISVDTKVGNNVSQIWQTPVPIKSISAPDKSVFETTIDDPESGGFKVNVIVDGIECTASTSVQGCNSYITTGPPITISGQPTKYLNNAGKPYWRGEQTYQDLPSGNVLTIRPVPWQRFPNSIPAGSCGCKIKLN